MKYSKILLVFAILLFQLNFAQEKAEVILNNSLIEAKKENKNVLLVFHASWCQWCKLMEKNMNLPETKPLFEKNYITTYLNVQERGEKKALENPGGGAMMNRYKGSSAGLPFWLVLNSKGEVLVDSFNEKGENLGSPATSEEVDVFLNKLRRTSKLTQEELQTIQKVFVKKKS